MKRQHSLIRLIAWLLQMQFAFAPSYVFAQDTETKTKKKKSLKDIQKSEGYQIGKAVIEGFTGAGGVGMMGMGGQMMSGAMNAAYPPMEAFNPQTGMDPYFKKCRMLQESADKASSAICRINNEMSLKYYNDYQIQAEKNANLYSSYAKGSNKGVINNINGAMPTPDSYNSLKCISTEVDNFAKLWNSRIKEIDGLIARLDKYHEDFDNRVQRDLVLPLENLQARLNGNSGGKKHLDDKEFKNFFNDPKCNSVTAVIGDFAKLGTEGGLNGIQAKITTEFETPYVHGGENYSPLRFLQSKGEIVRSITEGAQSIARNIQNKIDSSSEPNPSDVTNVANTGFKIEGVAAIEDAIKSELKIYSDLMKDIDSMGSQGKDLTELVAAAKSPNASFSEAQRKYDSNFYSSCFEEAFSKQGRNIDSFMAGIKMNDSFKGARNEFKIALQNIVAALRDGDITYDEFEAAYKKLRPGNSYVTGQVGSTSLMKPTVPFNQARTYCKRQYSRTEKGQKYSPKGLVAALASKSSQVKKKARNLANDAQTSILKRVIGCNGIKSTGAAANSCSKSSFDPSSANFCVDGATKCSANINACLGKAKSEIRKIETQRTEIVAALRIEVDNYKKVTQQGYDQISAKVIDYSAQLASMLPGAADAPLAKIFTFKEGEKGFFLDKDTNLTEDLKVEDPTLRFEKMRESIAALKDSILEQKKKVFNGDKELPAPFNGGLASYVNDTKRAYEEEANAWKEQMSICDQQVQAYTQQRQEQHDELNEKYIACMDVPTGDGNLDLEYLSEDTVAILEKLGARGLGKQIDRVDEAAGMNLEATVGNVRDEIAALEKQYEELLNTGHEDASGVASNIREAIKEKRQQIAAIEAHQALKRSIAKVETSCKAIEDQMISMKQENSGGNGRDLAGAAANFFN